MKNSVTDSTTPAVPVAPAIDAPTAPVAPVASVAPAIATPMRITGKDKFNALANAIHIFAFKEEGTKFKILDIVETDENIKLIAQTEHGEIVGIFTDSPSATNSLKEVYACFGNEQPFIKVKIRETKKGHSIYYVEVE